MYNETTGSITSDKNISTIGTKFTFTNIDKIFLGGYMQSAISFSSGELDLSGDQSDLSSIKELQEQKLTVALVKAIYSFYVYSESQSHLICIFWHLHSLPIKI